MGEKKKNMAQAVICPQCGVIFALCAVPHCYQDEEWMKDLRGYSRKGFIVDMVTADGALLNKCTCGFPENKRKVSDEPEFPFVEEVVEYPKMDHIKVVGDIAVCTACGGQQKIPYPLKHDALLTFLKTFMVTHAGCKKVEG